MVRNIQRYDLINNLFLKILINPKTPKPRKDEELVAARRLNGGLYAEILQSGNGMMKGERIPFIKKGRHKDF